ncbi:MAG: iron-sulfur cluster assembly scaffold protein, partial [Planctomycetota bacterium]
GQGRLECATHRGRATTPACGDVLDLDLEVEGGRILDARYRVQGCAGAIAAASALATLLPGRPARPDAVTREAIEEALGEVPRARRHALRLAVDALRAALESARRP